FIYSLFVVGFFHINEIDDDDPSHIPEAKLSGNFFYGHQIGLQSRSFLVTFLIGFVSAVDIHHMKGFGMFDDDISALWKTNSLSKEAFDLFFYSKTFKELSFSVVKLNNFFFFWGNGSYIRSH